MPQPGRALTAFAEDLDPMLSTHKTVYIWEPPTVTPVPGVQ